MSLHAFSGGARAYWGEWGAFAPPPNRDQNYIHYLKTFKKIYL